MMPRALTKSDIPQILMIEEAVQVAPWSEETFQMCLDAGYLGWVVEDKKNIMGFIIVSMRPSECHILNICVARPYQHKGYGALLLNTVLKKAYEAGVGIAYLEVRRSNSKAIGLYQKLNFFLVGERKNYYPMPHHKEDALVFAKDLQFNHGKNE